MPSFGNLLKKKRTRDKDDSSNKDPASPINDSEQASITGTVSNVSDKEATLPNNTTVESNDNKLLQQSPSQSQPTDRLTETQKENAAEMQKATVNEGAQAQQPVGNIQPAMAQTKAPPQPQHSGIKPMADGSWPVTRDAKATKGKYNLKDFDFQRTLGTGSFGRVHLVQSKHNQRFYAVKVLKKAQVVKMKQVEHTNDERRMLAKVKHPFLVTLWGTFSDSRNLYMVMDFVEGGELFSLLRKSQVRMAAVSFVVRRSV